MPIETKVQTRQTAQNFAYAVICLALAIWGWYDFAVRYPAQDALHNEYQTVKSKREELRKIDPALLTAEQRVALEAADTAFARFSEVPSPRSAFDYQIQIWVYMVGCGVGVPWFLFTQIGLMRRKYRLDDDGTLHAPEGTFASEQIVGLDLSKWMSKAIATVEVEGGTQIKMDDYKFRYTEDIVGVLAQRFYPGEWTSDARPIGDPKSRDTKKAAAEGADGGSGTDANGGRDHDHDGDSDGGADGGGDGGGDGD